MTWCGRASSCADRSLPALHGHIGHWTWIYLKCLPFCTFLPFQIVFKILHFFFPEVQLLLPFWKLHNWSEHVLMPSYGNLFGVALHRLYHLVDLNMSCKALFKILPFRALCERSISRLATFNPATHVQKSYAYLKDTKAHRKNCADGLLFT